MLPETALVALITGGSSVVNRLIFKPTDSSRHVSSMMLSVLFMLDSFLGHFRCALKRCGGSFQRHNDVS